MTDKNKSYIKKDRNYKLSHLISSSKKTEEYINDMADYYIRQNNMMSNEKSELQILYDAAQGIIDSDDYKYVTNPLNTANQQLQRFPAKLKNYDIIKPIISSFVGETSKRDHGASVTVANPDAQNRKKEALAEEMEKVLSQTIVNELNTLVDTGVPSQETQDPKEAQQAFEENYDDKRAIIGQEALDYIKYNVNLDQKVLKLMYDWVVAGRVFTFKEPRHDEVIYEVIDPRDVSVIGWGNNTYAEDAEAIVVSRQVTGNELLGKFYEEIREHKQKDEILKYIDQKMFDGNNISHDTINMSSHHFDTRDNSNSSLAIDTTGNITLYHVVWNTITKIYILHYESMLGELKEMYVDDTYVLDKENGDIKLEEIYICEWYENYRVDNVFYIDGGRGLAQRHMLNNMASCKLPYNGAMFGYRISEVDSKVKQMLSYQMLYNIFHYRWELLLAKNKEKIMALPLGMIPDGGGRGWDEDKFFYFMEAMNFMVYDETAPNAQQFIQGIKAVDMGLGHAMDKMWNNLLAIKQECWDLIGMNRQRYGDTYASDGKGNTEQAIFRSSILTAPMYFQFDKFLEQDYKGLLDVSKIAYSDGKKAAYINSDARTAWFEVGDLDVVDFMESEFNVFARNSIFEQEKIDKAENLILTMGQNGMTPDTMLEVLDANNMSKMKRYVKEGLAAEREFQQQMQQQQAQTAQMQSEAEKVKQDSKNATDIQVAQIQANAKLQASMNSMQDAGVEDLVEDTVNLESNAVANTESALAKKDATRQKTISQNKNDQLKREQMANQMAIAKENRNQYDK
tara:strand:- start:14958 stop:17339 length:2382 start_codon:yes stop_codon:yes gene_type:complete